MMTDPIADMLNRIRNAQAAKHSNVKVPASRLKQRIAEILVREGYLAAAESGGESERPEIEIKLRYISEKPAIRELKRVSTPGRRVYVGSDDIPRVFGGMGLAIVSTSRGILTGKEARRERLGGELLCTVY